MKSGFFKKTVILTLSNIITGTLSFIFSMMLSRKIGARGVGLYQLVMPLYALFLYISGGGITVTLSKIAAEKKATGKLRELYKTIRVLFIFEVFWSFIITAFVIISSGFISSNLLSDKRTFYGIIAFCPALIIVSLSSIYKGVFYGLQKVTEPALIDIIEKLCRIVVIYFLGKFIIDLDVQFSSAFAILSISLGELISFILFYICYKRYKIKNPGYGPSDNSFQLIFNVLKLALPLAANGILSTIFGTVTTVLIPKRLQSAGIPYENALSLLGRLQGMSMTIIFYPAIILNALNVILIPSISEAVTFKKSHIINHRMNIALKIASVTAFSSSAIILAIPSRLGELFFKDPSIGEMLKILIPGMPIVYLEIISFAILNGLGRQKNILINSTILSIFDMILIYVLLGIPDLNIKGYALNFFFSGILGLLLNYRTIKRNSQISIDIYNGFLLPILSSIAIYIITSNLINRITSTPIAILASYTSYALLYLPLYKFSNNKKHPSKYFMQ